MVPNYMAPLHEPQENVWLKTIYSTSQNQDHFSKKHVLQILGMFLIASVSHLSLSAHILGKLPIYNHDLAILACL